MSTDAIFGWGLAIAGAVCMIVGLAWEAFHAPTEVPEYTPIDELLEASSTEYPESFVLHSGIDDMGGQLCFDCGEEAEMHMPWAVSVQSSAVVLIEAALCFGCALVETSTETEEAE